MQRKIITLASACLPLCSLGANALEADATVGLRQGVVAYQIGGQVRVDTGEQGHVRFPLSELRFPLNTPVAGVELRHQHANGWLLSTSYLANTSNGSGVTEDRDWGINFWTDPAAYPRDSLDIYSESRTRLQGHDLRIEASKQVQLRFLPDWNTHLGGGLLLQEYNFKIFDVVQSYPSTPAEPAISVAGLVGIYEYQAQMPFISFKASRQLQHRLSLQLTAAYSPFLRVTDFDNHVLRNKTSDGKSDGWGLFVDASLRRQLNSSLSAFAQFNYLKTVANGIQTQHFPDEANFSNIEIGLRNQVEQASIRLGVEARF